jgi:triacylglycerol esterase/lipase EstA (alpha/beta hydrolase family)
LTSRNFVLMAKYLALHGRRRSYRIHLEGGQTLEELARALESFVRAVVEVTSVPRVELVAHSLGGIVVRLGLLDHDLAGCVKTVITLGTPHHGTHSARFADTVTIRELRPDSALMRRLASTPWPRGVRGATFWSRSDVMVLPPESATIEGTHQIEVTPFTHYSYLIDPRSWSLVRRELELAASRPSPTPSCDASPVA